ncbi:MAG TPA: SHOCT domain-containing protein [Chloroflexota bacterium]|nr:SHOCT domain-containing protein [Chloroflexota bacterium]
MMRRRGGIGRPGRGIVGTMATAAVVGGTAAAASHAIDRRMTGKDQAKQQEAEAEYAAVQSQADIEAMQAQMAAMQAQQAQMAMMAQQAQAAPAPAAPAAGGPDLMSQLQQLAQLKDAGALTDDEYAAAKAKLLA